MICPARFVEVSRRVRRAAGMIDPKKSTAETLRTQRPGRVGPRRRPTVANGDDLSAQARRLFGAKGLDHVDAGGARGGND